MKSIAIVAAVLFAQHAPAQPIVNSVSIDRPVVAPELEPLVKELLIVTKAPQRVAAAMGRVLSFENYRNTTAIPAAITMDPEKMQEALRVASEQQNRIYKQVYERTLKDAPLDDAAWYVYALLYGEGWTAEELKAMIAFYKSDVGRKIIDRDSQFHLWEQIRIMEFFGDRIRDAKRAVEREDLQKTNPARLAVDDMGLLGVALEFYAYDHDNLYPTETDPLKLEKLLEPAEYSVVDPWGTRFRFAFSPDRKHYRIISAGSDRKFDPKTPEWGAEPVVVDEPGADIIYEDGLPVRYPPGTTERLDE